MRRRYPFPLYACTTHFLGNTQNLFSLHERYSGADLLYELLPVNLY